MKTSSLELYVDPISQPVRAVMAFCEFNKIPATLKPMRIFRGDTFSEEFRKINPSGLLPFLKDGDLGLIESHAIMRYLASTQKVDDHWYPADPKIRAKVDQYLDWHHLNTRTAANWLRAKNNIPGQGGLRTYDEEVEKKLLDATLNHIENEFLSKTEFIATDGKPSIADLSAACELIQLELASFDFGKYPKIGRWLCKLFQMEPMQKAHKEFYIWVGKIKAKPKL